MNEIAFLEKKPDTIVKYGKVIIMNEQNEVEKYDRNSLQKGSIKKNNQKILNVILPIMYFKNEQGQHCYQKVETTPAKVCDVVDLQRNLDKELQRRQTREVGICPIREQLYGECFDELI